MKILKWLTVTFGVILLLTILVAIKSQAFAGTLTGINPDNSAPTGDPNVSLAILKSV